MGIVFMGTPEFAVPTLYGLIESNYDIQTVITQPDRPKGRGKTLMPPPIKVLAEQHHIPVLQPEKIRAPVIVQQLTMLAPEVIVVVAYGQILPEAILKIPRYGCINVHASLLPKYRGAAPIQWAVMNGERETGITTMRMDRGMDTGDILLQQTILIEPDDTTATLFEKLAHMGAELLLHTLHLLLQGGLTPIPQAHEAATYAPLLKKEDGLINWQESARRIAHKIRGLLPWPGAYTHFHGRTVKILKARAEPLEGETALVAPGTVASIDPAIGPLITTGDGGLRILEIQPENKPSMVCRDFCHGYHLAVGARFE